jgi:hypothetical protein
MSTCIARRADRSPFPRPAAGPPGPGPHQYGPRAALHWTEIKEITAKARRIMVEYPRNANTFGGTGRQLHLTALADDYSINLRTLYRYLAMGAFHSVRVGPWTAVFAERDQGEGTPTQISAWEHDDEHDDEGGGA